MPVQSMLGRAAIGSLGIGMRCALSVTDRPSAALQPRQWPAKGMWRARGCGGQWVDRRLISAATTAGAPAEGPGRRIPIKGRGLASRQCHDSRRCQRRYEKTAPLWLVVCNAVEPIAIAQRRISWRSHHIAPSTRDLTYALVEQAGFANSHAMMARPSRWGCAELEGCPGG